MKKFIIGLMLLSFLVFGCISSEYTHKQYADGSADITTTTDLSLFGESAQYAALFEQAFQEACESYGSEVDCVEENGVITLSKHFETSEAFYTFEVKDEIVIKRYRLTVDELPDFEEYQTDSGSSSLFDSDDYSYVSPYSSDYYSGLMGGDGPTRLTGPSSKFIGMTLESMGVEYTYIVQMPGEIVSAEGAVEYNGTTAVFDVVERMNEREKIVVISEELNWPVLLFVSGTIVVGVMLGTLLVMKMREPKESVEEVEQ